MGIRNGTERGKVYVLKSTKNGMYVTAHKGKRGGLYMGLYIGKPGGKRYSAVRFDGGPELNAKLALTGNADLIAVEVKA